VTLKELAHLVASLAASSSSTASFRSVLSPADNLIDWWR
jgi:hypothetical protein